MAEGEDGPPGEDRYFCEICKGFADHKTAKHPWPSRTDEPPIGSLEDLRQNVLVCRNCGTHFRRGGERNVCFNCGAPYGELDDEGGGNAEGESTIIPETGDRAIKIESEWIEWDIDANLPLYARDYVRLIDSGRVVNWDRIAGFEVDGQLHAKEGVRIILKPGPNLGEHEHLWANQYADNKIYRSVCTECGIERDVKKIGE